MAGSLTDKNTTSDVKDNAVVEIESGRTASNNRVHVGGDERLWVDSFTDSDNLKELYFEIAKGNISGHSFINKFGFLNNIDEGEYYDIYDYGEDVPIYPFPTSAQTTTVASTSANDTSTGTGARTVRVFGLDSSYNEISEDVTLNGTSNVTLSNQYLRLHRAFVLTGGSDGTNRGDIRFKHGATVLAQITTGYSQTLMCIFTIPAGKKGYLTAWDARLSARIGSSAKKGGLVRLVARPFDGVFLTKDLENIVKDFPFECGRKYKVPNVFDEKTDIKLQVFPYDNDCGISGNFDLILVDL